MKEEIVVRQIVYPPDEVAARAEPLPAQFGALSTLDGYATRVPRSREDVLAGMRGQELHLAVSGRHVVFRRASEQGPFPFNRSVVLVSVDVHAHHRLDPQELTAVAVAADRQWLDQMLVRGDDREAFDLAAGFGSRFVMRWTEEAMSVVDAVSGEEVDRFCVQGRQVVYRPCPVIPDACRGDRCKLHGGPWVSASMTAARNWSSRRSLFVRHLGCDVCDAQVREDDRSVPTRYDDWARFSQDSSDEQKTATGPRLRTITTADGLVIADSDQPVVLAKGSIVEIGGATPLWPQLRLLSVDPAGGSEDALDWSGVSSYWPTTQAELDRRVGGLEFVHRWAALGSLRITGVRLGDRVVPLAFDLQAPRLVVESELLRLGRWEFAAVGDWRFAMTCHRGFCQVDADQAVDEISDVARWLHVHDLLTLAALAIEPFDVDGEIEGFTRNGMLAFRRQLLGPAHVVGVDPVALREVLLDSAEYRRARGAMRWPHAHRPFWDRLRMAAVGRKDATPFRY